MKSPKASIALISILIISAFALLLVLAMSEVNVTRSFNYLNTSTQHESLYAAEACIEEAIIRLEADLTFTDTTLTFDSNKTCTITASGSNPITVNIEMNYDTYTENYSATLSLTQNGSANNLHLTSWQEL